MQSRTISAAVLTLACVLLGGCREHNEPVKPIAHQSVQETPGTQ